VKEASDIDTTTFAQRTVTELLETEDFDGHLARLRGEYKTRRDTMLRSLRDNFPAAARWMIPKAGAFIWVELPPEIDASALLKVAIEKERVAFIPGQAFCVNGNSRAKSCLRLNFSNSPPGLIEEGIQRLARVVRSFWPENAAAHYKTTMSESAAALNGEIDYLFWATSAHRLASSRNARRTASALKDCSERKRFWSRTSTEIENIGWINVQGLRIAPPPQPDRGGACASLRRRLISIDPPGREIASLSSPTVSAARQGHKQ